MTGEGNAVTGRMKRYDPNEEPPCPKCGQDVWDLKWAMPAPSLLDWLPAVPSEWLILTCVHCKYEIARLPLDAPDTEQGE